MDVVVEFMFRIVDVVRTFFVGDVEVELKFLVFDIVWWYIMMMMDVCVVMKSGDDVVSD